MSGGRTKTSTSNTSHHHDDEEGLKFSNFILGQSLSSVCHDPRAPYVSEWSTSELIPPPAGGLAPIKPTQFRPYLDKVAEPYRVFLENNNLEQLQISPRPERPSKAAEKFTKIEFPKIETVSLAEVPEIFYNENFSLEEAVAYAISDSAVSPVLHVQKLSHYLDLVEVDLLKHISLRRDSFFEALTNMHGLHEQVHESVDKIEAVRNGLNQADEEYVQGSLRVARLVAKRAHLAEVHKKLRMISDVRQTQPTIQILLSKGDYGTALDLIHSTQQILATDLVNVQSFKHMALQLREMAVLIEKMMQAEFVQFSMGSSAGLVADMSSLSGSTGSDVTLEDRVAPLINGLLRMHKLGVALEEYRAAMLKDFKQILRRCVTAKLTGNDPTPPVSSPTLSSLPQQTWHDTKYAVGRLTSSEFLALLRTVFAELEAQLMRVRGVHALVLKGLVEVPVVVEYRERVTDISGDAVYRVCEEALDRVARLLRSRNDQHSRLLVQEFATIYDTCMAFASTIEGIAGRQCHGLRPTIVQQAKQFLDTFHSNRVASLGLLLDNEDWSQVDIILEFQGIVDKICLPDPEDSENGMESTQEPASPKIEPPSPKNEPPRPKTPEHVPEPLSPLHDHTPSKEPLSPLHQGPKTPAPVAPATPVTPVTITTSTPSTPATPATPSAPADNGIRKSISLDGENYKVVNTALMLVKILAEYLQCMERLPTLSTDVVHRVVEILQLFNSRTLHLVLGAQARKLAQLKTITAKHLGLASQCLGLVIALVPHLRDRLSINLPSRHHILLADLDRVLGDYADHREQIFVKFVSILSERIQLHGKTMATLDYKDESLPCPTPPMAALTKDTTTLHRLLHELLPSHQVRIVFVRIISTFNSSLPEQLAKVEAPTRAARRRLHEDIAFLLLNLRKLALVEDPGSVLEDWFRAKFGAV